MKREIKFRAYLKADSTIYPVVAVHAKFEDEDFNRVFILRQFKKDNPKNYKNGIDCELMQSTGLKDKNGKDVFEGDLVQIFDNMESALIYEIKWRPDVYMLVGEGGPGEWLCIEEFEECQIIGNIYEHPELII